MIFENISFLLPFSPWERGQSSHCEYHDHRDEIDNISTVQYASADWAVMIIDSDFCNESI